MHTIARRLRDRRDRRVFDRTMRQASPAVRQELRAMTARVNDRVI